MFYFNCRRSLSKGKKGVGATDTETTTIQNWYRNTRDLEGGRAMLENVSKKCRRIRAEVEASLHQINLAVQNNPTPSSIDAANVFVNIVDINTIVDISVRKYVYLLMDSLKYLFVFHYCNCSSYIYI